MWKQLFSQQEEQSDDDNELQDNLLDETDNLCNLSPTQRLYGFAACSLAGLVCMFLSMIVFAIPIKFAVLFTFGNILAVGSTAFLMGATRQIQMMFDPVRIYATSIYIGSVVVALICAMLLHSKLLTIFAILCEICALIWYSLSYIPFARAVVSRVTISLFDTEIC
ncbi:Vesicle transport protein, Got1/SFT2-like protein [Artemisia annua]|uniref:Vesicle transport protein n=1 Tax=Artemisia annua TaxID=35608 RepID=A0A2U1PL10_ARTAN|nr:Vesicle transport protein, Got1/SFT2-like protein [Artemisia annua]